MFCLTAPIALVGELGSYVVPFVGIIAWSLFGIQEIGKQARAHSVTAVSHQWFFESPLSPTSLNSRTHIVAPSMLDPPSPLLPSLPASLCLSLPPLGMMIEEPFQRALKLEVFANTIRRDLSDLLHVCDVSPVPLNITSEALGTYFFSPLR